MDKICASMDQNLEVNTRNGPRHYCSSANHVSRNDRCIAFQKEIEGLHAEAKGSREAHCQYNYYSRSADVHRNQFSDIGLILSFGQARVDRSRNVDPHVKRHLGSEMGIGARHASVRLSKRSSRSLVSSKMSSRLPLRFMSPKMAPGYCTRNFMAIREACQSQRQSRYSIIKTQPVVGVTLTVFASLCSQVRLLP
jgi:hypothetical protein